ncbi:MAG: bifunctional diaminohydroxyphosphoribosylaminopyrimidine deaminase/5-amino-6-(5-phosphoribosylamino)uracil reductase RibD [Verrucomicrobiota bacterium]|jgi:diaminohydroxyphosphoribosylaminopyrimidine deaminase/5-amino-6-(5-phosphoribosylamino)uracil reductase
MKRSDLKFMRLALRLARHGYGATSPNPMVGTVLVKGGRVIGRGWHRRAGLPHAEIVALRAAQAHGHHPKGATLYVTLEPCSTHGRTPPCTDAIIVAGIQRVVAGVKDPNPLHSGKGFKILRRAGVRVDLLEAFRVPRLRGKGQGSRADRLKAELRALSCECARLNEAFNHWIVRRTPFVTVKAAMTLDGKIATATGESKWITGEPARAHAMRLRQGADAILVGVNTVLRDNPRLTFRRRKTESRKQIAGKLPRRIILDSLARTPLRAKVISDEFAAFTTIVVSRHAPKNRVAALARRVNVLVAPAKLVQAPAGPTCRAVASWRRRKLLAAGRSEGRSPRAILDLRWLLKNLGARNVTSLLVEGGGEVNASFLFGGFAQRVVFFYAPKILGGRDSVKAVAGPGAKTLTEAIPLCEMEWQKIGRDLLLTARLLEQ